MNAAFDDPITLQSLSGAALLPHLDEVARLRIAVFRDWPYLYDGDPGYEREYLAAYAGSPDSVVVLARVGEEVVGASTGIPLAQDSTEFQAPFLSRGIDVSRVFYCGESVLLPAYRGRGIGHAFFDAREAHARALGGFAWTAFAAVDRDPGDPRRPAAHRGNDAFWGKRGYEHRADLSTMLSWQDIGEAGETEKPMSFWLKPAR